MSKQDDGPDKKNEQPKDAPKTETTENDEIKKQENVESVNPEVQKSEENAENTPLADEQDTDNVNVEDGQPAPVEKPKRRFPRKALYICIVLVISVVIAGGVISVLIDRYGLGKTNKQIDITVPKGADTDTIASLLKKDGVIQYPFVFKIFYKRNHGKYNSFQSG
mgnify:CR=1 FL=1